MDFGITAKEVGILAFVMLLAYFCVKTGYIDIKVKDSISKVIVKIILPSLVISSISGKSLSPELLKNTGITVVLSVFTIALLFLLGMLVSKILKQNDSTKTVHRLMSSTGNVIFVGYPVIYAIYGETGFFYTIIYWLVNDLFLWTVGVYMLSRNGEEQKAGTSTLKKLLNPNTISFLLATLMLVLGIKLPPVIKPALEGVGALTTYLSMIFIGMALAGVNLKGIFNKWGIFLVAILKQILMPILLIFIFRMLKIDNVILGVVVLEAAMPAQTVLTILANEYKCDFEYAALGMFVTTLFSIVSLPIVSFFIQILL